MSRGMEGGSRFEGRSMENPYTRGIETRGDNGVEDRGERENYWLESIISPQRLERLQEYPAYEGHSKEWIIMDALLAKLVEQGAEMDQQARVRLRNLVSIFRVIMIPNLTQDEQAFMGELAQATTVNWSELQTEITSDAISDVRWLWGNFGLRKPNDQSGQGSLENLPEGLQLMLPDHPRR